VSSVLLVCLVLATLPYGQRDLNLVAAAFTVGGAGFILLTSWGVAWILARFSPNLRSVLGIISTDASSEREASSDQEIASILKHRGQLTASETAVLDRLLVMKEIDRRVDRLRERTALILGTIAIALVAAAIVVLFAGRLTSLDAAAVSNIDRANTEISNAQARLAKLYRYATLFNDLDRLIDKAASTSEANASADLSKQIYDKRREIFNLREFPSNVPIPEDSASTRNMIASAEANEKILTGLMEQVWKSELLAEHGYSDWRYIVATAITRVGVVLIIVFLVQILMGLYRYNTRLITYYNSRRDLLSLWEGDQKKLLPLNNVMAPPTFDFGKDPKHPLEDLIRAIGGQVNKSVRSPSHDKVAENK
jgi:hypothetical protein